MIATIRTHFLAPKKVRQGDPDPDDGDADPHRAGSGQEADRLNGHDEPDARQNADADRDTGLPGVGHGLR